MKQISLRQFQLTPTRYLTELPIELTRYGKVVAVLQSVNTKAEVSPKSVNTSASVNTSGSKSVNTMRDVFDKYRTKP